MKQKYIWHLIGWALFILYDYQQTLMFEDWDWQLLLIVMSYNAVIITTFYFTFSYLCPRFFKLGTWRFVLVSAPIAILFFIFLRYFVQELLFRLLFGFGNYYDLSFGPYFMDNIWRSFTPYVAGLITFLLDEKSKEKAVQSQLITEKNQAELAFLRTQLNPHFLFNTLSFLYTQAFQADQKLADTILKLSEVLRYSIRNSKTQQVTLKEEIQVLNNYIDIFRKRFEGRCFIDFTVKGEAVQQKIEPLLILPFIENAFKHGIHADSAHPIYAELIIEERQIIFNCENKIKTQQKDKGNGIGIENIRRRLNLLYPKAHNLNICNQEDNFKVALSLSL